MAMPFKEKAIVAGFALVAALTCAGLTKVTINLLEHKQPWLNDLLNGGARISMRAPTATPPPQIVRKKSDFEILCDKIAASAKKREAIAEAERQKEERAYHKRLRAYEKIVEAARRDKTGQTKIHRKPLRQAEIYRRDALNAMRIAIKTGRWPIIQEICKAYGCSPYKAAVIVIQESFFGEDTDTPLSSAGGAFQHKGLVGWERLAQYGAGFVQKAKKQIDCDIARISPAFIHEVSVLHPLVIVTPSKTSNSSSIELDIKGYKKLLAKETRGDNQDWRQKPDDELKKELAQRIDALRDNFAFSTALYAAYERDTSPSAGSVLGTRLAKAMEKLGMDFKTLFPDAEHYIHVWGNGGGPAMMRSAILNSEQTMFAALRPCYKTDEETVKALKNNKVNPDTTVGAFFYHQQEGWREQYRTVTEINDRLEKQGAPIRLTIKDGSGAVKKAEASNAPAPTG